MKYIDTVTEGVERLKDARKNMNKGVILLFISWIFVMIFSIFLFFIKWKVSATWFAALSVGYLVMIFGLIIKREIFSMMIYLKEEKQK